MWPTKELAVTAPAIEPISLDEARAQCRVDSHYEDDYLGTLISTARRHLEKLCWSGFITQTWTYYWDAFAAEMRLPRSPIQSITWVKYVPPEGGAAVAVTSTIYELGQRRGIHYLRNQYQQTWPTPRGHYDDVSAQVVCGYGATADSVPAEIRHAIKLLVAFMYLNRGEVPAELPPAIARLISPYRLKDE